MPQADLRIELFRITGTDLTPIDGIMTATTILSEAGWEMSKWQTEHHFVSWLRLCLGSGKGRLPTGKAMAAKPAGRLKPRFWRKEETSRTPEGPQNCTITAP